MLGFIPFGFSSSYIKPSNKSCKPVKLCQMIAVAFVLTVSEKGQHYPSVHKSFQAQVLLTWMKRPSET